MTDKTPMQVVTFGLGEEVFAVPVTMVREILDYRPAFRVPNGPAWMLGITDVRGQGVPMIDLRMRLGLSAVEPTLATRVLIVDVILADRMLSLGLVVDRVIAVATFERERLEAAPDIGLRWRSDYIAGVVREADGFVVIIDAAQVFSNDDGAIATLATAA
ncbi:MULTISPECIES: chemotaxis protein CheW [Sphingomonas]|jgi:purine-binding chemotaxis protein CheW|uniref:Chemotaxis protein CheW n=1 Tax=Sphingomonas hankookensis TaxID=563996 RepID=A0ABR5Y7U2_9SPHN|nr:MULTISPECIES: chemotaxis protein CheW [Sphingomonas]KZE08555.1 chemotaxis protein CheW [Sphingomonas hankookensis]PZT90268.1 MAG: chemotaxis protein CheW [Sphingomonas sp.]RSV19115.1 chemotaxis protein CheW [Sphingomonas sp. ABOLH]WCP71307.1 chemotaxis protein CheW [Sphingomonas hankookensis]